MQQIETYFPHLTPRQRQQLGALFDLYRTWNERINVVSRKDIDQLYLHHVLHSLAIARVCEFAPGSRILDVGCGGGFPGVPLAILFPESHFTLVDSIGKKIRVVEEVSREIGLQNLRAIHDRAEKVEGRFDYVVSRAVTEMKPFLEWTWDKIDRGSRAGSLPNGVLYLKGGDLQQEMAATGRAYRSFAIRDFFDDPFFETKQVIYIER